MNGTQKAWGGAVVSTLVALVSAAIIASEDGVFTTTEWLTIVLAGLVSLAAVFCTDYQTPNKIDGIPIKQELVRAPLAPEEPEDEHS